MTNVSYMKITVIGTGYVGLVSGACLAELGHEVTCLDVQSEKIQALNQGILPIYEPGLDEMVNRNALAGRLMFTDSYAKAIPRAELISIAVGTPSAVDGSVDLSYVESAAGEIAKHLSGYVVIADKSTVPVGTAEKVESIIREISGIDIDVVSNPEFLREGHAVFDFLHPARIVIGSASSQASEHMLRVYEHVDCPKLVMDRRSAELAKYAANAFLATKISFINEMAMLSEALGADISNIALGIGSDPRIGKDFLRPGPGWGGSCFPKDVRAIKKMGDEHNLELPVVNAAFTMNRKAGTRLMDKLESHLGGLRDKNIAVLGLAFKSNTDDTRESPAVDFIRRLMESGANIRVHDPVAKLASHDLNGLELEHLDCPYETALKAHAVIIATEWEQFRALDLERLKQSASGAVILDTRNLLEPERVRAQGFVYLSVGR